MKLFKMLRKTQKELKKAIRREWRGYGYNVIEADGYLYKEGTFPVLLVAHMDTVHKSKPTTIHNVDNILSSPMGIGGDDRCGIFMIQEIIKKYDCSVVLTEDEEIGCVGAGKFAKSELAKSLKGNFCYIIELDRRGKNDAVFYYCDNYEFENFITEEYWKTNFGSYSDICEIAQELGVAAVNFSCGYYNEHTEKETINLDEMNRNIKEVCRLLARTDEEKKFEYVEAVYSYKKGAYYDVWEDYYDWYGDSKTNRTVYGDEWAVGYTDENGMLDYEIVWADSEYEAIGMFLCDHRDMTYNDIDFVESYADYKYDLEQMKTATA